MFLDNINTVKDANGRDLLSTISESNAMRSKSGSADNGYTIEDVQNLNDFARTTL